MTKQSASHVASGSGSLAFDYANALVAQRLGGTSRPQPTQNVRGQSKSSDTRSTEREPEKEAAVR